MATQYRIGEFAYLGGVSAKTLRFYDEIGLLRPASVDARTGYRQYRSEQLEELASIVSLKSLGLPLANVRSQLNGAGSRKDRRDLLCELKRSIEQSIHRLRDLCNTLMQLWRSLMFRSAPFPWS